MAISIRCPRCGQEYRVRDELAGKKAKCRCGETFAVSVPVVEPAPMAAILDEEHLFGPALADASMTLSPLRGKRRLHRKGMNPAMIAAIVGGSVVGFLLIGLIVVLLTGSSSMPTTTASSPVTPAGSIVSSARWPTPESVFHALIEASFKRDWKTFYETLTPESQKMLVGMIAMASVIAAPESPDVQALVTKHGLDPAKMMGAITRMGSAPNAEQPKAMLDLFIQFAEPISDRSGFFIEAMRILPTTSVAKQIGIDELKLGKLRKEYEKRKNNPKYFGNIVIHGDTAFSTSPGKSEIRFRRIDGNWRIAIDPSGIGLPGQRRR